MQPSMFNVRVPLEGSNDVFLMNTFTDAQLDRLARRRPICSTAFRAGRSTALNDDEREALSTLTENGFLVESRDVDRQNVHQFFHSVRENQDQLRVTVLTTLQCNFACDYCFQGDHGDYNTHAAKMSMDTAERVARWTEDRLDALKPESFALTFFGGEPLLNLPVMYFLAERMWKSCEARGVADAGEHHHERSAADARGRRPDGAVRLERRQDHARRRPRHAQPDAAAARRPGHVRQDHQEHPAGRGANAASRSAATSTRSRSTPIPALLDFLAEQEFARQAVARRVQAGHPCAAATDAGARGTAASSSR